MQRKQERSCFLSRLHASNLQSPSTTVCREPRLGQTVISFYLGTSIHASTDSEEYFTNHILHKTTTKSPDHSEEKGGVYLHYFHTLKQ